MNFVGALINKLEPIIISVPYIKLRIDQLKKFDIKKRKPKIKKNFQQLAEHLVNLSKNYDAKIWKELGIDFGRVVHLIALS